MTTDKGAAERAMEELDKAFMCAMESIDSNDIKRFKDATLATAATVKVLAAERDALKEKYEKLKSASADLVEAISLSDVGFEDFVLQAMFCTRAALAKKQEP